MTQQLPCRGPLHWILLEHLHDKVCRQRAVMGQIDVQSWLTADFALQRCLQTLAELSVWESLLLSPPPLPPGGRGGGTKGMNKTSAAAKDGPSPSLEFSACI